MHASQLWIIEVKSDVFCNFVSGFLSFQRTRQNFFVYSVNVNLKLKNLVNLCNNNIFVYVKLAMPEKS